MLRIDSTFIFFVVVSRMFFVKAPLKGLSLCQLRPDFAPVAGKKILPANGPVRCFFYMRSQNRQAACRNFFMSPVRD